MPKWVRPQYGASAKADLGHGLSISVSYESIERLDEGEPHWNVTVFGRRLKVRSATEEEARNRAIVLARKWLNEALSELST